MKTDNLPTRTADPLTWHCGDMHEIIGGPRFGLQEQAYRDYIARQCLGLSPGLSLADVGCGSADSTLVLAPYVLPGGRVTAFDRDVDVLRLAAKNAGAVPHGEIVSFHCSDATRLPAASNVFDVTWCQTLLMHLADPGAALREMARIVKPGGLVAATEPDWTTATVTHSNARLARTPSEAGLWARALARIMEGGRRRRAGDWGIGSRIHWLFHEAGLENIRTRAVPASWIVAPRSDGRAADRALYMTLALFYPQAGSQLVEQQEQNFLAGGGTEAGWNRFQTLRDRERAAIVLCHAKGHAHLHVHCPAFLTTGRKPPGGTNGHAVFTSQAGEPGPLHGTSPKRR